MAAKPPRFWASDPGSSVLARALSPFGSVYHWAVQRRFKSTTAYRAPCSVICVGNATMGGVGKTPFVRMVAEGLKAEGRKPVILSRGYGGSLPGPILLTDSHTAAEVGDEPLLLSRTLPVVVAKDRAAGAHFAAKHGDILVMDDGLQNPSVTKDLSFLLIDNDTIFGNGSVFPAGPLRERPGAALERSAAVVAVLGSETDGAARAISVFARDKPVLEAWFALDETTVPDGPLHAFCGIGRPERFHRALERAGAQTTRFEAFGDHQPLGPAELQPMRERAREAGARLVTTEKDFVRLAVRDREDITPILGAMRLRDEEPLWRLIGDQL